MKTIFFPLMRLFFVLVLSFTSIAAAPYTRPPRTPTEILLQDLGGVECFEGSIFTCVTIEVPLDHFNPGDPRTIPIVFAVHPATGARKGMFVTATGGPGISGILSADPYFYGFDPSIPEVFDIVFFDQRGMGLSGGLTCPFAATDFYLQDFRGKTPNQEAALKKTASTFSAACESEMGNTELLPFLGTRQAVEDLETFRQFIGDETFWLYGESYGTQYAQTYAAAHSDRLAGLILDGTVDLTLDGITFYAQQAQAFNDTLVASLTSCNDDPVCREDMSGNAVKAYDKLVTRLSDRPISFNFPLPQGGYAKRKFTLSDLEFVASSQMYNEDDRMMFTRALAAFNSKQDLVPLARLFYIDVALDPQTLDVIPDPSWSDAIYYGVECQDYGYRGNTPEEKADNYLDAADPFEFSIPRLASIIYGDLPCAYWTAATSDLTRPEYLFAEGVPTLVLGATADPATPVNNGIDVYQHLADAYLITQQGGPHVIYGRGNECPDALVTDFLVKDRVPSQRETLCEGYVAGEHVPLAPRNASAFQNPSQALSSVETEIDYLPEFYYWDGLTPTSTACADRGTLSFEANNAGTKYNFTLDHCAFTKNFILTGKGSYNTDNDRFVLDVSTTGRWTCDLKYVRTGERIKITGKCGRSSINEDSNDDDHAFHKVSSPDASRYTH
jgi:pimeloyl-ACP methyl ester carboxylesterase